MKIKPIHTITAAGVAASLAVFSVGCGGGSSTNTADLRNYNIVFVVADQEHYFSQYPAGTNYQARKFLSENGITFEKHYACSNMSTSSRSTMFTGKHVPDTRMIDNCDFPWQPVMNPDIRTIGDIMRNAGYYTALKGKWHLGGTGDITGETEATVTSLEDYGFSDWGGTDYIGALRQGNEIDPLIVEEAVEWLGNKGKNLNAEGKPFFLLVTMINPHDIMDYDITGYQAPKLHLGGAPDSEIYKTRYDTPIPLTYSFDLTDSELPEGIRLYSHNWGVLAGPFDQNDRGINFNGENLSTVESLWKDYQDYYFNCIQDSDNNLMKLIRYLQNNDMLRNTIIIFTSDHGEMHGSHGLKGKGGFIYENNIHVPLIILHPDYEGGKKIDAVTSHIDLAATLADIGGTLSSEKLSGKSLLPLMLGDKKSVRDGALFCYEMPSMSVPINYSKSDSSSLGKSYVAGFLKLLQSIKTEGSMDRGIIRGIITNDGYKFVRYFAPYNFNTPTTSRDLFASNDVQLFDTKNDPEERINLADKNHREANITLIMSLNGVMNAMIKQEVVNENSEHIMKPLREYCESVQQQAGQ